MVQYFKQLERKKNCCNKHGYVYYFQEVFSQCQSRANIKPAEHIVSITTWNNSDDYYAAPDKTTMVVNYIPATTVAMKSHD